MATVFGDNVYNASLVELQRSIGANAHRRLERREAGAVMRTAFGQRAQRLASEYHNFNFSDCRVVT